MVDETDGQTAPQNPFADEGLTDPATWEDPKESFTGIVRVSEIIAAPQEYLEKFCDVRSISGAAKEKVLAEGFKQWNLQVERFDLIREDAETNERTPWMIWRAGIDLYKWDKNQQAIVPLNSRHKKEHKVRTAYQKIYGPIQPASVLVGKMFTFDFYQTLSIGGWPYNNVLVPTSTLLPDYVFDGEPRVVRVSRKEEDAGESTVADNGLGTTEQLSETAAMDVVVGAIVGQKATDPAGLIGAVPQEAQLNTIVSGLALGANGLVKELVEAGRIAIGDDGVIVAA